MLTLFERLNAHVERYKKLNNTDHVSAYVLAEFYALEMNLDRNDVYLFIDETEGSYNLTRTNDAFKLTLITVGSFIIFHKDGLGNGDIKIYSKKEGRK